MKAARVARRGSRLAESSKALIALEEDPMNLIRLVPV
jgi:hypothetical protein